MSLRNCIYYFYIPYCPFSFCCLSLILREKEKIEKNRTLEKKLVIMYYGTFSIQTPSQNGQNILTSWKMLTDVRIQRIKILKYILFYRVKGFYVCFSLIAYKHSQSHNFRQHVIFKDNYTLVSVKLCTYSQLCGFI